MSMIRGALRGVAVAAAGLMWIGMAHAQDGQTNPPPTPHEVVQHCLQEMGDITQSTLDAIHARTDRGVGAVINLAQDGAGPIELIRAGEVAKSACTMAARRGQQALDDALGRCLRVLHSIDAPEEAGGVLIEARRRAGLAIGNSLTECKRHINRVVARALGGGGGGVSDVSASALVTE